MSYLKKFYVIRYLAGEEGAPYFFRKKFTPELPDYDKFNEPPNPKAFEESYALRVVAENIFADYFPDDNIVSKAVLELCEKLGVNFFSRSLELTLSKKGRPDKEYYLFFLMDYLSILDRAKSVYLDGEDLSDFTGNIARPLQKKNRYFYDEIERFVVLDEISRDLFWCLDISQPVCSEKFKANFEELNLNGINFIPLDDNYRYDPWREDI